MSTLLIAIAALTASPAPSALDHAVRKPAVVAPAPAPKKLEPKPGCVVRDLEQGSGQVRICG